MRLVTLSIEGTRAHLARIPLEVKCCEECPGWCASESDKYGLQIETCDECMVSLEKLGHDRLFDEDVRQLPEAQVALLQASLDAKRAEIAAVAPERKHPRVAAVVVKEVLRISIEMRPPRTGEIGELVFPKDVDPKDALAQVIDLCSGITDGGHGPCGYGFIADEDLPEYSEPEYEEEEGGRYITVIIETENVEVDEIKLL